MNMADRVTVKEALDCDAHPLYMPSILLLLQGKRLQLDTCGRYTSRTRDDSTKAAEFLDKTSSHAAFDNPSG